MYKDLQGRITQLDRDLKALIQQRRFGVEFNQKEQEIRRLKKQLAQVEVDLHKLTEAPVSYSPFSPFSAQTTPNPFLPTPEPAYSPFETIHMSHLQRRITHLLCSDLPLLLLRLLISPLLFLSLHHFEEYYPPELIIS